MSTMTKGWKLAWGILVYLCVCLAFLTALFWGIGIIPYKKEYRTHEKVIPSIEITQTTTGLDTFYIYRFKQKP